MLEYDILALTETRNLHPNKHFITGDAVPVGDRYAGVAMIFFGECSEVCHAHLLPRVAYSVCHDQVVTVQPVSGVCICAPRCKTTPHIIRRPLDDLDNLLCIIPRNDCVIVIIIEDVNAKLSRNNQKSEILYLAHWPTIINAYEYTYYVNGPWAGRLPKDCNISRSHGSHNGRLTGICGASTAEQTRRVTCSVA